jgi:hypothetical protein
MAKGNLYKTSFAIGWILNFVLFCLVCYVLVTTITTPNEELDREMQLGIYISFSVFAVLFLCFTTFFAVFLARKTYLNLILVIVCIVGQFLCVLVTSISLFSSDAKDPNVEYFGDDPVQWIIDRRWLPLVFAIVFLPLFALQIFMISQYGTHLGLTARASGANDNRNYQEKIYIAKEGNGP